MAMNKSVVQFLLLLNLVMILLPKAISDNGYGDPETGVVIIFGFNVYKDACPEAEAIIFSWVQRAVIEDPRMAASLLRLHFHDCFVNACSFNITTPNHNDFN